MCFDPARLTGPVSSWVFRGLWSWDCGERVRDQMEGPDMHEMVPGIAVLEMQGTPPQSDGLLLVFKECLAP